MLHMQHQLCCYAESMVKSLKYTTRLYAIVLWMYVYSGKFSMGPIFELFVDNRQLNVRNKFNCAVHNGHNGHEHMHL